MQILDFTPRHSQQAYELVCCNYAEERAAVPALPDITPASPKPFAVNGYGVAAFDGEEMLGFLACHLPWENAFTGTARGTFSPIEAHGAVPKQREKIYKLLYQAAAEKWVTAGIASHSIALYAHDAAALRAFFSCGFGLRCVDAVRGMEDVLFSADMSGLSSRHDALQIDAASHPNPLMDQTVVFTESGRDELPLVAPLGVLLTQHLSASPCFMKFPREETAASWLAHQAERKSRVFTAACDGTPIAFLEVTSEGENFATLSPSMTNLCGAYCLPEFRGQGVMPRLLNHVIHTLRQEGYEQLGVDYESFNLTAGSFWPKYFTPYTNGVVRRIDENIFDET